MDAEYVSLYTTVASTEEARTIATTLIDERLTACVNILGEAISIYQWQGACEESTEIIMLAKTRADLAKKAIARITALHSYECPCVVTWPIIEGFPAYLDWVSAQTK